MMAFSSLNCRYTEQTTAVVSPVVSSPIINYVHAHVDEEVKKKIVSTIIESLPLPEGASVLVQVWAPTVIRKASLLTTTHQPFRVFGKNKKLEEYRIGCLNHKLYVYIDENKEAAFGLAGRAYLYRTSQWTQNVHDYPEDQRPQCKESIKESIFKEKWSSVAVPMFHAEKCVGVLDVVMDAPTGSLVKILGIVKRALKEAGLQTAIIIDRKDRDYIHPKPMVRRSKSFHKTGYQCLVPLFGLSAECAAKRLKLTEGTFRNVCRKVGIPMWPYASSIPKAQINQSAYETRTFITPYADSISFQNEEFHRSPLEQRMPSDSDVQFPELADFDFSAFLGETDYHGNNALGRDNPGSMSDEESNSIDHQNADLYSIGNEEFHRLLLEQSETRDHAQLPEPAMGMEYLASIYDEEMININHHNAYLYSISGKGLSEQPLEQSITIDFGPSFMADNDGMEFLDSSYDDTWIGQLYAENN